MKRVLLGLYLCLFIFSVVNIGVYACHNEEQRVSYKKVLLKEAEARVRTLKVGAKIYFVANILVE